MASQSDTGGALLLILMVHPLAVGIDPAVVGWNLCRVLCIQIWHSWAFGLLQAGSGRGKGGNTFLYSEKEGGGKWKARGIQEGSMANDGLQCSLGRER